MLLLAAAGGCGTERQATRLTRVYADMNQLVAAHPGLQALRQMDEQIAALATLAGVDEQLPVLTPPPPLVLPKSAAPQAAQATPPAVLLPPVPAPTEQSFLAQAQHAGETHLAALEQELADSRSRKVALRRSQLLAGLAEEMQQEADRLREPQFTDEQAAYKQFRRQLFNLELSLKSKDLSPEQHQRLQEQLRQTEAQQDAAVAAVRQRYQDELAALRAEKQQRLDAAVAAYEAQLKTEDDQTLQARHSQMAAELSRAQARAAQAAQQAKALLPSPALAARSQAPAPVQLAKQLRVQRAQVQTTVTESRQALQARLVTLKASRAKLWASLQEDIKAALAEIGASHGVTFVLAPNPSADLPDYTTQACTWLTVYWSQPTVPAKL